MFKISRGTLTADQIVYLSNKVETGSTQSDGELGFQNSEPVVIEKHNGDQVAVVKNSDVDQTSAAGEQPTVEHHQECLTDTKLLVNSRKPDAKENDREAKQQLILHMKDHWKVYNSTVTKRIFWTNAARQLRANGIRLSRSTVWAKSGGKKLDDVWRKMVSDHKKFVTKIKQTGEGNQKEQFFYKQLVELLHKFLNGPI